MPLRLWTLAFGLWTCLLAIPAACQELQIVTTTLPDAVVQKPYSVRLQVSGGRGPYVWRLDIPPLPEGLRLLPSGEITGTPFSLASSRFTVRVSDAGRPAQSLTRDFTLQVVAPLLLQSESLPRAVRGRPYNVELRARGGTPPLRWRVVSGVLPAGLELQPATGLLVGVPKSEGEFRFTVQVMDAGKPAQTQRRVFAGMVFAPLMIQFKRPPQVQDGGIYGSVEVSNITPDDFDLTVIVVAVNEQSKAFTLGHKHFPLPKGTVGHEIPFGFPLPRGSYQVHADAVAEVAPSNSIYRARQQQGPLRVE